MLGRSFLTTSVIIFIDFDEEMVGTIRTNTFDGASENILTLTHINLDAAF